MSFISQIHINELSQILAIGILPILGSAITLIIQHHFQKSVIKNERQHILERELFFNLQKQAEKVFVEINKIRWNFERMTKFMENGDLTEFESSIKNTQKEYLVYISPAQVYFPDDIFQKLDQVVKISRDYQNLIREIVQARDGAGVTEEQRNRNIELVNEFNKAVRSCKEEILTLVKSQRKVTEK